MTNSHIDLEEKVKCDFMIENSWFYFALLRNS